MNIQHYVLLFLLIGIMLPACRPESQEVIMIPVVLDKDTEYFEMDKRNLLEIKVWPTYIYYMYDFYSADSTVNYKSLIVQEYIINDSLSRLQITNNNQCMKEIYCATVYDKMWYETYTKRGLSFSEDSLHFELLYPFTSMTKEIVTKSPFGFFKKGFDISMISLDSIQILENNKLLYYSEYFPICQTIFIENLKLPVYCKNTHSNEYYILSEIVGGKEMEKNLQIDILPANK